MNRIPFLLLSLAVPATAFASGGVRLEDRRDEHRYVVTIAGDPVRTVEAPAAAPIVVRMPRASIIHRFRAELVAADGDRITKFPDWSVTFMSAMHDALARLTSVRALVELPRPYGVRLESSDSMIVVATVPDGLQGAVLRLNIEY